MPAPKHFAPTAAPPDDVEFTVAFTRDGIEETHTFTARPRVRFSDLRGLLAGERDPHQSLDSMDGIVRRCLLDSDGTPEKWSPDVEGDVYTAPDGTEQPAELLKQHTAFEAGSSRRRWAQLVDSDDAEIGMRQVAEIADWLAGQAAERPTRRSSH